MKYSMIVHIAPRMLRKNDAGVFVGGQALLERMERADPPWITPALAAHKMTIYDVKKLQVCCDRISDGEVPQAADTTLGGGS